MLKSFLRNSSVQKSIMVIFSIYLKFAFSTMRWSHHYHQGYDHDLIKDEKIYAIWHSRLLGLPNIVNKRQQTHMLTSQSRDGKLGAVLCKFFGIKTVWGSSNQGAISGFKSMARLLKSGQNVCISPDGPRGPARKAAPGVIAISKMSKTPIVPITWSADRFKRVNSWDRMVIPRPFAKGYVIYGKPISIETQDRELDIHQACLDLEDTLNEITAEADLHFGHPAEHLDSRYGRGK